MSSLDLASLLLLRAPTQPDGYLQTSDDTPYLNRDKAHHLVDAHLGSLK